MKKKQFHRRLTLNKKTISHLNQQEMRNANGGVFTEFNSICPQCPPDPSWDYCDDTVFYTCYIHSCTPSCP